MTQQWVEGESPYFKQTVAMIRGRCPTVCVGLSAQGGSEPLDVCAHGGREFPEDSLKLAVRAGSFGYRCGCIRVWVLWLVQKNDL